MYTFWTSTNLSSILLFRDPDASETIKCAFRWESTPCNESVSYGSGQRYNSVHMQSFHSINISRGFSLPPVYDNYVPVLPTLRLYTEKPPDADLWLPPVNLCTVAAAVLRGTDASCDGPVSAEQLNGQLWTTGRTVRPPRCCEKTLLLKIVFYLMRVFCSF